ncbi:MAG: tetratricopeptide repeat protein [Proteobacteria bacterium]|nr:tetratricopeptide repeat protein [Pseudomonadota bacterium]
MPTRLRDALVERNFAVRTEHGWSFAHGLIQESIERSAAEAGRLESHHTICVEVLRHSHAPPGRLGRHLLAAGRTVEGVDALLAAADRAWEADDYLAAGQLLGQRERVLERIEHPREDARWGLGWERRALVRWRMGDLVGGLTLAERASDAAEVHDWPDVAARALDVQARMTRYQGRLDEALALAERALALARDHGEGRLIARTERVLARVLTDRGRFDEARALASSARSAFESMFHVAGVIDCERTMYSIARQTGDLPEARRIATELRGIQELRGHRWGLAHAWSAWAKSSAIRGTWMRPKSTTARRTRCSAPSTRWTPEPMPAR